ncbi:MAG: DmsC/YnfH family molybdoenzyme membrane anchor subunit [Burkholderiaceae bacterium]|jgi:formate-dependent nitrite reductase membrane component NrfD|nr:DmsC/YnfH family molybdoenzyme membrane anchor subunit [Burkholderiaceae bacterium]
MASAFFCGEVGAGLFFVSMLQGQLAGMVLGLLLGAMGKAFFHLLHMGVPGRSWRAVLRPDRSWISRGLIAIIVFAGAGALYAIHAAIGGPDWLGSVLGVLAAASALVVMTYQGFAMAHSTAIGLWSTAMMPFSSFLYALTSGVVLVLFLGSLRQVPPAEGVLIAVAMTLLGSLLLMLSSIVHAAFHGSPGARVSAKLLIQTRYAGWSYGLVVIVGVVLPLVMLWIWGELTGTLAIAAVGTLAGFFAFRVLLFRAGVYEPVMTLR